jgi:GT2 family glycosyltransferase
VDVVVVNWNTGDCLRACLASLNASVGVELESVVVVDNASVDGSPDHLPELSTLRVLRNHDNRGFAAACNQGSAMGAAPLVLFLNPDTVVEPTTLARAAWYLLDPSAQAARRGVCGGSLTRPDGTPAISASRFPTLANTASSVVPALGRLLRTQPRHVPPAELTRSTVVDQVIGAFFLVRRDLLDELGGFDERFFVYYEEVDLCRRALDRGWTTFHAADARLVHVENVSARASGGRALGYSLRSRQLYAELHWPVWQQRMLMLLTVFVEIPLRLARSLVTAPTTLPRVLDAASSYLRLIARSDHAAT